MISDDPCSQFQFGDTAVIPSCDQKVRMKMDLPPGTILESDDEIRQVQDAIRQQAASSQHAKAGRSDTLGESSDTQADREQPFRPTVRPPTATLVVYDDGQASGEIIRLRHDRLIIGRCEGDLQFPDDEQISKRHVALTRQVVSEQYRWVVTDLQSRNGLFVRVNKAPLSNQSEFLIGHGRYRFDVVQNDVADTASFANIKMDRKAPITRAHAGKLSLGTEALSEVLAGGIGSRLVLTESEYWIGSDSDCDIVRANDLFTKSQHAKLTRSTKGTWMIQNNGSLNGVWLKLPQVTVAVGGSCEFQIGEQRLKLKFGKL